MGTRNLTIVKLDGKVRVAQYCQWDGYPTGQGVTIAKFLRTIKTTKQKTAFKERVRRLKFASNKMQEDGWKKCGSDGSGWVTMDVSIKFKAAYPELHRDTGADILNLIRDGRVLFVANQIKFLQDTTFCEYAYEIDLDKNIVRVYAGSTKPFKTYKFSQFTVRAMSTLENSLAKAYEAETV